MNVKDFVQHTFGAAVHSNTPAASLDESVESPELLAREIGRALLSESGDAPETIMETDLGYAVVGAGNVVFVSNDGHTETTVLDLGEGEGPKLSANLEEGDPDYASAMAWAKTLPHRGTQKYAAAYIQWLKDGGEGEPPQSDLPDRGKRQLRLTLQSKFGIMPESEELDGDFVIEGKEPRDYTDAEQLQHAKKLAKQFTLAQLRKKQAIVQAQQQTAFKQKNDDALANLEVMFNTFTQAISIQQFGEAADDADTIVEFRDRVRRNKGKRGRPAGLARNFRRNFAMEDLNCIVTTPSGAKLTVKTARALEALQQKYGDALVIEDLDEAVLSKKYFVQLAKQIKTHKPKDKFTRDGVADMFADLFGTVSTTFDRERFMKAAKAEEGEEPTEEAYLSAKDFNAVAKKLRAKRPAWFTKRELVDMLSDFLATTSQQFDRERFAKACGVNDTNDDTTEGEHTVEIETLHNWFLEHTDVTTLDTAVLDRYDAACESRDLDAALLALDEMGLTEEPLDEIRRMTAMQIRKRGISAKKRGRSAKHRMELKKSRITYKKSSALRNKAKRYRRKYRPRAGATESVEEVALDTTGDDLIEVEMIDLPVDESDLPMFDMLMQEVGFEPEVGHDGEHYVLTLPAPMMEMLYEYFDAENEADADDALDEAAALFKNPAKNLGKIKIDRHVGAKFLKGTKGIEEAGKKDDEEDDEDETCPECGADLDSDGNCPECDDEDDEEDDEEDEAVEEAAKKGKKAKCKAMKDAMSKMADEDEEMLTFAMHEAGWDFDTDVVDEERLDELFKTIRKLWKKRKEIKAGGSGVNRVGPTPEKFKRWKSQAGAGAAARAHVKAARSRNWESAASVRPF